MLNKRLIDEAIDIVIDYLAANEISTTTNIIKENVIDWYNHSDITDAYTLAAVALDGPYNSAYTWDDILFLKTFYFGTIEDLLSTPSVYLDFPEIDNFSIEEIEMAQHDKEWW